MNAPGTTDRMPRRQALLALAAATLPAVRRGDPPGFGGTAPARAVNAADHAPSTTLGALTFNIRYDNPGDGVHAWPDRRDRVVALIRSLDADVVGLQEVLPSQRAYLEEHLGEAAAVGDSQSAAPPHRDEAAGQPPRRYVFRGVGRDDGAGRGEQSPVLYRADRFDELGWGTWWLSETPDQPSRGWDGALNRIATCVRLKDRSTGTTLLVVSTHFDHRGERARLESARLLAAKLGEEPRIVLLGDFNASPGSPPHRVLTGFLTDAAGDDDRATWCGWDGEPDPGARIDWILTRGFTPAGYRVHAWADRDRPESDHLPVAAILRYA